MSIITLYKFFPINKYTIGNLVNRQNWVADPSCFNDPFEFCKRRSYHLKEGGIEYLKSEENKIQKAIHTHAESLGVVCYTECNVNNSLMWSHYGDNHRGICLAFEIDLSARLGLHKVKYTKILPEINLTHSKTAIRDNFLTIATTKSDAWAYENEWRQIVTEKNIRIKYPVEIKQIFFGCRCPLEDMQIIWNLLIPHYGTTLEFAKGKIDEGTFNLMFSIHPKEFNELNKFPKIW